MNNEAKEMIQFICTALLGCLLAALFITSMFTTLDTNSRVKEIQVDLIKLKGCSK